MIQNLKYRKKSHFSFFSIFVTLICIGTVMIQNLSQAKGKTSSHLTQLLTKSGVLSTFRHFL